MSVLLQFINLLHTGDKPYETSKINKNVFFFFFFFFFFTTAIGRLLTNALMPKKAVQCIQMITSAISKYWFKQFYKSLFYLIT